MGGGGVDPAGKRKSVLGRWQPTGFQGPWRLAHNLIFCFFSYGDYPQILSCIKSVKKARPDVTKILQI